MKWTRDYCEERVKADANDVKAVLRLGLLEVQAREYERALAYLHRVVELDAAFMPIHVQMKIGEAYYKLGQSEQALTYFGKAKEGFKPYEDYLIELFLAKCLDKLRRFAEAIRAYEVAIELYKEEQEAEDVLAGNMEFRLGWAYVRSGVDFGKGVQHLREALRTQRDNTDIMVKLAGVLFKEFGDTSESLEILDKAMGIDPYNPEIYKLRGKILSKKGEYQEAVAAFQGLIKMQVE